MTKNRPYGIIQSVLLNLVSILNKQSDKGPLVAEAALYYGFAPYEVLVIGNSLNDATMFDAGYNFLCGKPENGDPVIT